MSAEFVTVVSGLPRSGTSLMMQMLHAGGMPAVSDGQRAADVDNPRGYFEVEAVKKLKEDSSWIADAKGKVLKAISMLLFDLPKEHSYRVVFMLRHMDEILASQKEMLKRRGTLKEGGPTDEQMKQFFESHLTKVKTWLAAQPNFEVLYCPYNEVLEKPAEHVSRLASFLGGNLDQAAMTQAVDLNLYRNRNRSNP
jgi:sulfotransferase family protein